MAERRINFSLIKKDLGKITSRITGERRVSGSVGFSGQLSFNVSTAGAVEQQAVEVKIEAKEEMIETEAKEPTKSTLIKGFEKNSDDSQSLADARLEEEYCERFNIPRRDDLGTVEADDLDKKFLAMYGLE